MDKQISDMRQMYASSTSRINNLDLITTRLVKSPKPQHPDTNDTVQNDRLIMMEAQIQSMVSNIDTQTPAQSVRSNDLTDIEETQPKTRFTQAPNTQTAETQQNEQANGSDTTISSFVDFTGIINTDTARSGSRKVTHPTDKSIKVTFTDKPVVHPKPQNISNDDEEELTGFVVSRHKRQRYSAVFVAGIVLKNDSIDDTIESIYKHIKKKGFEARGIWKIKQTRFTLSVKIVLPRECIDQVTYDGFWPDGIMCRQWIDRTGQNNTQNNG